MTNIPGSWLVAGEFQDPGPDHHKGKDGRGRGHLRVKISRDPEGRGSHQKTGIQKLVTGPAAQPPQLPGPKI